MSSWSLQHGDERGMILVTSTTLYAWPAHEPLYVTRFGEEKIHLRPNDPDGTVGFFMTPAALQVVLMDYAVVAKVLESRVT